MAEAATRQRVLQAAVRLLNHAHSPARLAVGRVAAEAGVSRATVYRYFPDRTALLRAAAGANGTTGAATLDTRSQLLDVALAVILERGIHATTLKQIADRAGISLSGLHWYFKNKDELIVGLVDHLQVLPTVAREATLAADADFETQLRHIGEAIIAGLGGRGRLLRLVLCEAAVYPDVRRLWSTHILAHALPLLTGIFDEHARRGTLRPGPAAVRAQAFVSMFVVRALLASLAADLVLADDTTSLHEYLHIMLRGVLANPTGAPP